MNDVMYKRAGPLVLLIPEKPDEERGKVAEAWEEQGKTVLALGKFWEPPVLDCSTVRLYGNDTLLSGAGPVAEFATGLPC
ncbi:hypothetical protein GCM10008938_01020 [Deinococcus roseus]|uniref:Uncharacterized protein n=1 Tax=Deinococcus roseus TaxID=392414 RepID=A0ABQ2CUT8_9DEIO|nr:hypothetical protein GCM10008938_01020 [Deinococcus roseus]